MITKQYRTPKRKTPGTNLTRLMEYVQRCLFVTNSRCQEYGNRSCRGIGALLRELVPKYSAGILLIWLFCVLD